MQIFIFLNVGIRLRRAARSWASHPKFLLPRCGYTSLMLLRIEQKVWTFMYVFCRHHCSITLSTSSFFDLRINYSAGKNDARDYAAMSCPCCKSVVRFSYILPSDTSASVIDIPSCFANFLRTKVSCKQ
jgi:hypothetical protein